MAEKLAQMSIHEKLTRLARNLWWSWDPEVTDVFRLIDPELWEKVNHNPVLLLKEYPSDRLRVSVRERPCCILVFIGRIGGFRSI